MRNQLLKVAAGLALIIALSTVNAIAQTTSPTSTPSPTPSPSPVDVMYTGRLLGYFRVPSLQKFENFKGCPDTSKDDSPAAYAFLDKRKTSNAILVGTGDNFAPQLEARMFLQIPKKGAKEPDEYVPANKELYYGDGKDGWEPYESASDETLKRIAAGLGTIPTDNVACFLRAARFAAIVPGKHDFYFGADRVRQLARFLASTSKENKYEPVQMLGANLVVKTTRIDGSTPPKAEQPGIGGWPDDKYEIKNLKEGQTVYPWFSYVKIKTNNPGALKEVYLCKSPGGPDQIPEDFKTKCGEPLKQEPPPPNQDDKLVYLRLPPREGRKETEAKKKETADEDKQTSDKKPFFSTLEPGKNYGLCIVEPPPKDSTDAPTNHCLRFSVHTPFFYFPHDAPKASADNYTDPDPFVLKDRVAIFGVVDPDLAGQVGILNFGWQNEQNALTSRVSVEDPAEALRQQLDYFNAVVENNFTGLKILLAQTNPQRARVLAAQFPEFQMVVSGADYQQATSDVEMSSTWDTNRRKRAFVAVPAPYYNAESETTEEAREGSVYFGTVTASQPDPDKWKLESATSIRPVAIKRAEENLADEFWKRIKDLPGCLPEKLKGLPDGDEGDADKKTYLKWMVLCSMRDYTGADVALIQRRDLFDHIAQAKDLLARATAEQEGPELNRYIQQTLDSLIWKADLVTLLYVPGSAIKNALKKSATYDSEEKSSLSLVSDKDRQLETLGIREEDDEYFINDLPLDENKIYAVATTDYIGAGDTGYPDLKNAALNPRPHPAAFTKKLVPISGLVCSKLFTKPDDIKKYCLKSLESDKYLDETTAQQIPTYKAPGFSKKLGDFFKSGLPAGGTEATTKADAIENTVHRREIWKLSLEKFSFGFKGLSKNLSDKEVGEKFEGIPVSGVTATESETYDVGLSTRLSRSSHKRELYIQTGLEFERNSTGDTPSAFQISQAKNRLFSETGLVVWRTPGRSLPNFGLNFSIYAETQVTRPFSDFDLTTGDKIRITQNRSLQVLPRFGLRWQGLANSAEIGIQAGEEINALSGYQFTTPGGVVECLAKDAPSFSKCIADNSDPEKGGLITKDTPHSVVSDDRPRAGMYWKVVLSRPITSKIKYELEDTGDFFFVNFGKDTTLDTRLRIIQKHRLSFVIWPSVTIGPALDLLIYQNKVNRDLLIQRQFGFETNISFDIFNRRERGVQLKHKP